MEEEPKLQPGIGFHLEPDGTWSPKEIPSEVLSEAKYSGYLTIEGYRCFVFETQSLEQWAQKVPGTSGVASEILMKTNSIASRVASQWLLAKEKDLEVQVSEIMKDERRDTEYDDAIINYVETSFSIIEGLNELVEDTADQFFKASQEVSHHNDPRIDKNFGSKLKESLMDAGRKIKETGDSVILQIVSDLKKLKTDALHEEESVLFDPTPVEIGEEVMVKPQIEDYEV